MEDPRIQTGHVAGPMGSTALVNGRMEARGHGAPYGYIIMFGIRKTAIIRQNGENLMETKASSLYYKSWLPFSPEAKHHGSTD
jgi:hypothetical protein